MAWMKASWRIAQHALGGRKGRTTLLVLAVTMAATLTASLSTGMRSMQASIERRITKAIGETDARIVHRYSSPFDAGLIDEVRTWPGIKRAAARLAGSLTLSRADGKKGEDGRKLRLTAKARGVDVKHDEEFRQIDLLEGRLPATAAEILIDPLTSERLEASIGDVLIVERFGPPIELTVVGIQERQMLGALQKPKVQVDRSVISEATGQKAKATVISVILDDGIETEAWVDANKHKVEAPLVVESAELARTGYDRQIKGAGIGLVIFTVLGFVTCSLIVAVGMTTAVGEQVRQMAMIRCIGGSKRALAGSQILVGLFIGGIGAILGTPLGIGLAWLMVQYFSDVMRAGLVVPPMGVVAAMAGAIVAGAGGALYPAWQAARTSPLAALANRSKPPTLRGILICGGVGLGLIGLQLLLMLPENATVRFWLYEFIGTPALIVGYFLLAVPVFAVLSFLLGPLTAKIWGLPRPLFVGSLRAAPFRLGLTAGALMLGLSTLVSIWSNGLAMEKDMTNRIRFADAFAFRSTGLSADEQDAIISLPGVVSGTPIGYMPLKLAEEQRLGIESLAPANVVAIGFEPREFFKMNNIEWLQGTQETAIPKLEDGSGVLVAPEFLTARGMGVGDTITLGTFDDASDFEIVGVVGAGGLDLAAQTFGIRSVYMEQAVSAVFLDFNTVEDKFGSREAYIVQLDLEDGLLLDDESEAAFGDLVTEAVPGMSFATGRSIKMLVNDIAGMILGLSATLALAALLVACLGVANVVAAGVTSRAFEFGVLEAVGANRSLAARLVLAESTLTGCAAIIVGFCVGVHFAWMGVVLFRDLIGLSLELIIPYRATIVGAAILLGAVLLATLPAALSLIRKPARELLASGRGG